MTSTALVNALSTHADLTEAVEDVQMRLQKMAEEKGENEQGMVKITFDRVLLTRS